MADHNRRFEMPGEGEGQADELPDDGGKTVEQYEAELKDAMIFGATERKIAQIRGRLEKKRKEQGGEGKKE